MSTVTAGQAVAKAQMEFLGPDPNSTDAKFVVIETYDPHSVTVQPNCVRFKLYELEPEDVFLFGLIRLGPGVKRINNSPWYYTMGRFLTVDEYETQYPGKKNKITWLRQQACKGVVVIERGKMINEFPLGPEDEFLGNLG